MQSSIIKLLKIRLLVINLQIYDNFCLIAKNEGIHLRTPSFFMN